MVALEENIELDLRLDGIPISVPLTKLGAAQILYNQPVHRAEVKSDYALLIGILRDYKSWGEAELFRPTGTFTREVQLAPGDRLSILYGDKYVAVDIQAVSHSEQVGNYHEQFNAWLSSGLRRLEEGFQWATDNYIEQEFHQHQKGIKSDPLLRDIIPKLNESSYPLTLMHRDKTRYARYKQLLRLLAEEEMRTLSPSMSKLLADE